MTRQMKTIIKAFAPTALLIVGFTASASGHSGGLDAQGCHNNRKTGDYHCHRRALPSADNQQPNGSVPRSVLCIFCKSIQAMSFVDFFDLD